MPSPRTQTEYFALQGGLNLVSPALAIPPGMLIDCNNFEPSIYGGYSRVKGRERFDGRAAPSDAVYYVMAVTFTGVVLAGHTVTGATSGATARVLQVNAAEVIATLLAGTFTPGEALLVSATPRATLLSIDQNAATTPLLHAQYKSLAANVYRALITEVPGTGPVRGVRYYNGNLYAFRNNNIGTQCLMYRATVAGWVLVAFGQELQFAQRSSVVTITIASPGVITWTGTMPAVNQRVTFSTSGVLPTGIAAGVPYYVLSVAGSTFQIAATQGGAAISTTAPQSGVHTGFIVGTEVLEGQTVTGATSGAVGVARRVLLRTGSWNTAPVGTIVFDTIVGTFANGEALTVGGVTVLQAASASTAISLLPNGRFVFDNNNFYGTPATYRMYGCDGVNPAFEFDGARLVLIRTGNLPDNPKYLAIWQDMLVIGIGASLQFSSIGNPYGWSAVTGAAETALGDVCTGLLPQIGSQTTGALAVFTPRKTYMYYGTSTADLQKSDQAPDAGAADYTAQNIAFAYYLDTKGVVQINSTQSFGNFESSTITRQVQPFIDAKRGLARASCIVRSKNQYRLYFSDGTGLTIYITQQTTDAGTETGAAQAIMPFTYSTNGMFINGVDSTVDASGVERLFAAGSDGFVYELDRGTSMDGENITAHMLLSFISSKTPRTRKHYKRVILQADCKGVAQVNVGYDLSYAGIESDSGLRTLQTLVGAGGYWDQVNWEGFNWDSPVVQEYVIDTPGNGRNIGMLIYSDNAIDETYTISSAIMNYIVNRLER